MIQKLAWVFGIVFILIGILGFIPTFTSGGLLFGFFSMDMAHNILHLVTGILAVLAALGSERYARLYFKLLGIVYAAVTVIGFIQGDTVLGLAAVNTADNVLNLVIALVALWAGFGIHEERMQGPLSVSTSTM